MLNIPHKVFTKNKKGGNQDVTISNSQINLNSGIKRKIEWFYSVDRCKNTSRIPRGHIRQAKNIPLQRILSFKGKQEAPVYVICQSGMRSKQATKELKKMGYDVINVRGGMNQWFEPTVGGK